jgi:hypothetical protein
VVQRGASLIEDAALTLRLRTTRGQKLTLHMMRGGDGFLGRLGGGDGQRAGLIALAAWARRHGASADA